MYTETDTLLSLKEVNLTLGNNKILRDINLEIKDIVGVGQVNTLLGRSGVGKTKLMQCIAGLQRPTSGQILIGKDQRSVRPGEVGMVLQNYPLFGHYTVLGNLKLVNSDKAKIDELLVEFDIWDHRNKWVGQLSGGQRQRVAIVQQLLCSDEFILLDEPFSGLDPVATEKLCLNITKVANHKDQNTVIISSHVLEPSIAISDTVIMVGHHYTTDVLTEQVLEPGKLTYTKTKIEGATIVKEIDLAAQGLAWNPEIRRDPRFTSMIEDIRQIFKEI